jgi:prepilin-type N-terminal cleavage/methylation domain-containing protein
MLSSRRSLKGFSLVELVIVIVIIGIVAAIAVPRISRGAKGASESAVRGDLAALRAAIDLYAAEHQGVYPGKVKADGTGTAGGAQDFIDQLTKYTDINGKTGEYNVGAGVVYGPYLRHGIPPLPVGPDAGSTQVRFDTNSPPTAAESDGVGWAFNVTTGEIIADTTATDEAGTAYSTY